MTAVTAGSEHTCAIHNGEVKCWGKSLDGQAGPSCITVGAVIKPSCTVPKTVPGLTGAVAVSAGPNFTCAIKAGALYCWGDNQLGQLGSAASFGVSTPVVVPGMGTGVSAVSAGTTHVCAIQNGGVKCWGEFAPGVVSAPSPILNWTSGIVAIASSSHKTVVIRNGGLEQVPAYVGNYTYGYGFNYALGNVQGAGPTTAVSAGENHICAVQGGAVYCFGDNSKGQLANGTTNAATPFTALPAVGFSGGGINALSSGSSANHGCAFQNSALKCWGSNRQGQVEIKNELFYSAVPIVTGHPVTAIPSSWGTAPQSFCSISSVTTGLTCYGSNSYGQAGNGTTTAVPLPGLPVVGLGAGVTYASTSPRHSCAVFNGGLKCWGLATSGQTGSGSLVSANASSPGTVVNMLSGVTKVSTSGYSTCAIQNGAVKCWGLHSEIGNGKPTGYTATPVTIEAQTNHTDLVQGISSHCTLAGGAVRCWGNSSEYGLLGNGSINTVATTPVAVIGLDKNVGRLAKVSYFGDTLFAVQGSASGSGSVVMGWGNNFENQLGVRRNLFFKSPQLIIY